MAETLTLGLRTRGRRALSALLETPPPVNLSTLAAGAAFSALLTSAATAQIIDYPDFSSVAGLTLNSDAAQVGTVLRVSSANISTKGSVGPTAVMAGETWNWQCWYRDNNPDPTSNFTDGISILFQ